jgi:hypothetical protein
VADLFPIVRDPASGNARDLQESDVLLLAELDRVTAGALTIGASTSTSLVIGSSACSFTLDSSSLILNSAGLFDLNCVGVDIDSTGLYDLDATSVNIDAGNGGTLGIGSGTFTSSINIGTKGTRSAITIGSTNLTNLRGDAKAIGHWATESCVMRIDANDVSTRTLELRSANSGAGAGNIHIYATDNIYFDALNMITPLYLNESGDSDLSGFSAFSIIGCLNELKTEAISTLQEAYDSGNGTIDLDTSGDFIINLNSDSAAGDSFNVYSTSGGADYFRLTAASASLLNCTGELRAFDINASDAITLDAAASSNFSVAGSGVTLTLSVLGHSSNKIVMTSSGTGADSMDFNTAGGIDMDAVADIAFTTSGGGVKFDDQYLTSAIPISESGTTGLAGYSATSIVGAINEANNYYETAESTAVSTTSSTSWQEKLSHTTGTLPAGTYRIGWYYEWYYTSTGSSWRGKIEVNDTTIIAVPWETPADSASDQVYPRYGFRPYTHASEGTIQIDIDWRSESGLATAGIKQARIEIWRI